MVPFIIAAKADRIVLAGPRQCKYNYQLLLDAGFPKAKLIKFETPKETLAYLNDAIKGGETILFKGARFLEGVVEPLLAHKRDAARLCRREPMWVRRRADWGL